MKENRQYRELCCIIVSLSCIFDRIGLYNSVIPAKTFEQVLQ
jgi:hypothetical protein